MTAMSDASVPPPAGSARALFPLPKPGKSGLPSTLAFCLHKAGSTLMDVVIHDMAKQAGVTPLSIDSELWKLGIPQNKAPADMSELFSKTGYFFGVFRPAERSYDIPILQTNRSVLQIRDPRDILVSLYFSMTRSHLSPPEGSAVANTFDASREYAKECNLDEYAIQVSPWLMSCYYEMMPMLKNPLCRVFRYEDIIFEKQKWVRDLARHFEWTNLSDDYLDRLAANNDIRPKEEQPNEHIRSVTPGDHKRKFKPETIKELNRIFDAVLKQFGYTN